METDKSHSHISVVVESLETQLAILEGAVATLTDKLKPILLPFALKAENRDKEGEEQNRNLPPLAEELLVICNNITILRLEVDDINERLGL